MDRRSILGQGSQGTVYRVLYHNQNAVEKHVLGDPESTLRLQREVQAHCMIGKGVPEVLYHEGTSAVFTMAPGTSLSHYTGVSEGEALVLVRGILEVVARSHHLGLAHRDLKPAHIFVWNNKVTIIDWGMVAIRGLQGSATGNNVVGTAAWMSPALLTSPKVPTLEDYQRGDVHAVGLLLIYLLTGRNPYIGAPADEIQRQKVKSRGIPAIPQHCSPFTRRFLYLLLAAPPSAAQALALLNVRPPPPRLFRDIAIGGLLAGTVTGALIFPLLVLLAP